MPTTSVIGQKASDFTLQESRRISKRTTAYRFKQLQIAFLLTRNQMMNQHGATSGNGLMHGRPTRLTDHQMMLGQQLRHPPRPTNQAHTTRVSISESLSTADQSAHIATHHNGQTDVGGSIEHGASVRTEHTRIRSGEIEYTEGAAGIILGNRALGGKSRVHWKSSSGDFTGRQWWIHALARLLVSDKPMVRGRAQP